MLLLLLWTVVEEFASCLLTRVGCDVGYDCAGVAAAIVSVVAAGAVVVAGAVVGRQYLVGKLNTSSIALLCRANLQLVLSHIEAKMLVGRDLSWGRRRDVCLAHHSDHPSDICESRRSCFL